jgi:hypothetical protein
MDNTYKGYSSENISKCNELLESVRPRLGRFIEEKLYGWGLEESDILLLDEVGLGFSGIPIFGSEMQQSDGGEFVHIDIAIREEKYTGPVSNQIHPIKILLPLATYTDIYHNYGIGVEDFIKGRNFFDLPTISIDLCGTSVNVPEPALHVEAFAKDTILFYPLSLESELKIKEWFDKLKLIKEVSESLGRQDVRSSADWAIEKSIERWKSQGWEWLVT